MAEAQVAYGHDLIDSPVVQVVTSITPPPRAGSLVVTRAGSLADQDLPAIRGLAGVVMIKPFVISVEAAQISGSHGSSASAPLASITVDLEVERMVKLCSEAELPLILVPGFGEPHQTAEDIRLAFLSELKRSSSRLHAHLISLVLEEGLVGLIEELSGWIGRPLAIESADFKVLAAKNMGPTPPGQQSALAADVAEMVARWRRSQEESQLASFVQKPVRAGRRLVLPILLDGVVAGYFSAMVRPTDDVETIAEYLQPGALAAMVDFSIRRKDMSAFTVTQSSLLKDLLLGRSLSAADLERLERHFGFDLCDGLLVCAVQAVPPNLPLGKAQPSAEEKFVSVEVEGTRVFVIPFDRKAGRTWQQEAEILVSRLKKDNADLKIQLGAGRITETTLDLPDSYRAARQSLIVGSMMHPDNEFAIGYADLGVRRLLYLMFDHPEVDRFCEENLAPLEAYDAEWESELLPTLSVYLKHGANLNSAARALFVHRHTLRYRLEQIAEILNVDIDSQEVLLNLQIAFLIKEMKGKSPA